MWLMDANVPGKCASSDAEPVSPASLEIGIPYRVYASMMRELATVLEVFFVFVYNKKTSRGLIADN